MLRMVTQWEATPETRSMESALSQTRTGEVRTLREWAAAPVAADACGVPGPREPCSEVTETSRAIPVSPFDLSAQRYWEWISLDQPRD